MVAELDGECGEKCLSYEGIDDNNSVLFVSGNGTKYNEQAIYTSIDRRFGKNMPYISTVKVLLGHTLGAKATRVCPR